MHLLSIIIPVYNEEKTIKQIIDKILNIPELNTEQTQYIIVNDGSTDSTSTILKTSSHIHDSRFRIITHQKNLGKGCAIRSALNYTTGIYTIIQDADLEYEPKDICTLLAYAKEHNLPVVYGSRNINKNNQKGGLFFYWGGVFLSKLTNILYRQKITDEATGYKLFNTELLKSLDLTCERFEFCPEVTALLSKKAIKITELPIHYIPRPKSEGKKINFRDGIEAVWTLLRLKVHIKNEYILALLLTIFTLAVYFLTWTGYFMGYEEETAKAAVALLEGRYEVKRAGVGAAFLYFPFVAIGKVFFSSKIDRLLTIVPLFYSALTPGIIFLSLRQIKTKTSVAIFTTLLIGLGTLIWPYSKIGMEYQAMFLISLLLLSLLHWRNKLINSYPTTILYAGLFLGWLTITKSYGIVFIIPTLLFIGYSLHERDKQNFLKNIIKPSFLIKLIGPAFFFAILTVVINIVIFQRISGAYKLNNEFQIWNWWEGFWGIFFSFGKSILLYNPLLIVSCFVWTTFYHRNKALSWFILGSFIILLLITAPFSYWSDETLSVRKLVPIIPFLHLPLIYLLELIEKNRIKKFFLGVIIGITLYVQLINSLYSYWNQLPFLRLGNVDSLAHMRYTPQLSHIYLHHKFFISYLSKKILDYNSTLTYEEKSWMRCCFPPKSSEIMLAKIHTDLARYETPNIFIIRSTTVYKKILLLSNNVFWIIIIGLTLAANYSTYHRLEKSRITKNQTLV